MDTRRDVTAVLTLTAVSGVVDAVSFLGLGEVFLANMTGNVAILGFALLTEDPEQGARAAASLVAFTLGALLGGALTADRRGAALGGRRLHGLLVLEAAALSLAALAVALLGPGPGEELEGGGRYALIVAVSAAMGVQGAFGRRLAVADVPTTVVTSTLTGLAVDSRLAGGPGTRRGRRALAVLSLLVGAAVGGVLVTWTTLHLGLVLAAVLVAGVLVGTRRGSGSPARSDRGRQG